MQDSLVTKSKGKGNSNKRQDTRLATYKTNYQFAYARDKLATFIQVANYILLSNI